VQLEQMPERRSAHLHLPRSNGIRMFGDRVDFFMYRKDEVRPVSGRNFQQEIDVSRRVFKGIPMCVFGNHSVQTCTHRRAVSSYRNNRVARPYQALSDVKTNPGMGAGNDHG
jgi:hypothetical protein